MQEMITSIDAIYRVNQDFSVFYAMFRLTFH